MMRHLLTAFALLLLLAETSGCSRAQRGPSQVVVVAAGDVIAQRDVKRAAAWYAGHGAGHEGWDGLLEALRPIVSAADIGFCNLESPIIDAPDPTVQPREAEGEEEFPKFYGPPAMAAALRAAGFRVVSVANNHAHDMGAGGIEGTRDALLGFGLEAAGLTENKAQQPVRVRVGDFTLRFMAATLKMNKNLPGGFTAYDVQQIDPARPEALVAMVKQARGSGEQVVVSLHWGTEWGRSADPAQRALAHRLCDAGAVLVLGHHAHVAQSIEIYHAADGRKCGIAWCLGNLLAYERIHPEGNVGMLLRAVLEPDVQGGLEVAELGWQPTWVVRDGERLTVRAGEPPAKDDLARREMESAERRVGPRRLR
jgi:poly-gamma-glutamate synthesis protein (capsule biosynthesis protein)